MSYGPMYHGIVVRWDHCKVDLHSRDTGHSDFDLALCTVTQVVHGNK